MIIPDVCNFCKNDRLKYGCVIGRCFGPRVLTKQTSANTPVRPSAVRPIGPKKTVVAHEFRSGSTGGVYLVVELECGCKIWKRAGKNPKIPKTSQCFHCSGGIQVCCGGGCNKISSEKERRKLWFLHKLTWWCPGCVQRLFGPAIS